VTTDHLSSRAPAATQHECASRGHLLCMGLFSRLCPDRAPVAYLPGARGQTTDDVALKENSDHHERGRSPLSIAPPLTTVDALEPVWLATMTGRVLASVLVNSAAKKYSFQHSTAKA